MQHQFSRYDIIKVLEQHRDSLTYLVSTRDQQKQKAILKIFQKPALLGLAKRDPFFQRLDTLIHIEHPHIVPIIDGGIENGSSYVVSEYMAGGSLRARLDKIMPERLPFEEALTIVLHIGQALDYLHARQIVHGHLKPKHIFFDGLEQVFLSDIYLPDQLWSVKQEELLSDICYFSPEQCQETTNVQVSTPLSDQYALCCIAYELFTGQTPFTSTDILDLKEQQLHLKPAPLISIVADLPDPINEAILKGLEKDPFQRYPKITSLLTTLQEVAQTTSQPALPIVTATQAVLPTVTATESALPIVTATQPALPVASTEQITAPAPVLASKPTDKSYADIIARVAAADASASLMTTKPARKNKLWLALVPLAIICGLIIYMVYAPLSSAVSVAHNDSHTQTDISPTAISTQSPRSRATATPTATAIIVDHLHPTVTATPQMEPMSQPTPTATAIAALFTGQLSTQAGLLSTSSTNLIPQLTVDNVRIEADITVTGSGGGVAFRSNANATTGYRFVVETSGTYDLMTATQILATGPSTAIKTGNDVSNHVTIVAVGTEINISINAQSVVSISNSAYSSGRIGVIAAPIAQTTSTNCDFSIYAD
jgi:serine/threonine protein kinase